MDFVTAVKTCFSKYFDAKGRATRPEYWWFYLLYVIVYAASSWLSPIFGLILLGMLIPLVTAGIRRMHDTGRSGWFLLIPIANLVFLCSPGTPGPNNYGRPDGDLGSQPNQPIISVRDSS